MNFILIFYLKYDILNINIINNLKKVIKWEKPLNVWKSMWKYPTLTELPNLVNSTASKIFWVIHNEDSNFRKHFLIWHRINNGKNLSDNKKHSIQLPFKTLNNTIIKDLSVKWKAFELFIQYFIEKYWAIKITPIPAELDYNNKVDFVFDYLWIKIWFDAGLWNGVKKKRTKILEYSKIIDKTKKSSLKERLTKKRIKWKWPNYPINLEYFSIKFLHETNWIVTINPANYITKKLDLKKDIKNNFLLDTYNSYINDWWKKDIEEYMPEEAKKEFILIWKILPKAIEEFISFIKNKKNWNTVKQLDDKKWEITIQYNSWKINSVTININLWIEKTNYVNIYIPITNKLLKEIDEIN